MASDNDSQDKQRLRQKTICFQLIRSLTSQVLSIRSGYECTRNEIYSHFHQWNAKCIPRFCEQTLILLLLIVIRMRSQFSIRRLFCSLPSNQFVLCPAISGWNIELHVICVAVIGLMSQIRCSSHNSLIIWSCETIFQFVVCIFNSLRSEEWMRI